VALRVISRQRSNSVASASKRTSTNPSRRNLVYEYTPLAGFVPNKVYSFDHVAVNDSVIACDMAATGLADEMLDVGVLSLVNGLNYPDYLQEAYRLLKYGGWLKIAEAASRWGDGKLEQLLSALASCGFSMGTT
jgi:hypothetical protein